jgi:murein DD-endopeptidase MepM/ murein hydrolase activator NlpD
MIIYRALKTNIITQLFGENKNPIYKTLGMLGHNGYDYSAKDSECIYWDTDGRGTVIETSIDSSGGLGVIVYSEDQEKYYKHRFWHLKKFECKTGQILESGDLIGLADNTGVSTGIHLHRDLKECDKNYNTLNYENGYLGAIDLKPYLENVFILDIIDLQKKVIVLAQTYIALLKAKLGIKS